MLRPMMESESAIVHTAGGYGPPGGGGYPPGGGYGGPPPMGPPPGGFGAPPQAPPGGGYGQPPPNAFGGGPPGGFPPNAPIGSGGDVNTTLTMILSIISLACCCFPLGIVALVNVLNANKAKQTGDLATAQAKNKTALICAIIGIISGLIGYTAFGIIQAANNHAF